MAWLRRNKALLSVVVPGLLIVTSWVISARNGSELAAYSAMLAAAVIAGVPIVKEAWTRLLNRRFSIPLLITVASVGAVWIGEVWEAAAVTFLYQFGTYLESMTLARTRAALRDLFDLRPQTARVRGEDGAWHEVAADEVKVGQIVAVKPGEKVPVDGQVISGRAAFDTAALTGEPLPKEVDVGDAVLSGSVNQGGYVEIEAERVATDTTFNRLIRFVAQAQSDKPRVQRFIDRFAQWYTPAIILTAVALFAWTRDVHMALTFLVIACPGALVVAAPVAVVAGLGRAARSGMLIKGGDRLERIGRLNTVAFDKTGTLTVGKPSVASVMGFDAEPDEVLTMAAAAETGSEHHLAKAILTRATEEGIEIQEGEDREFYPGRGISARIDGRFVLVGNEKLMTEQGITFDDRMGEAVKDREESGESLAFVAVDGRLIGLISITDPMRPEASRLVPALKAAGIKNTVMLTGDHQGAANRVAESLGLDQVYAGLLPEDKVKAIRELQESGAVVGMIGDGINDAPALSTADVSVAMGGSGTHVAMEAADIVLMEDRLDRVPQAIALSRRILRIVRQNVAISVATVALLLVGVLTRNVGLSLGMLVHEASVLLVIANGMRLLVRTKAEERRADRYELVTAS